jgi:hypothetical protein
LTPAAAAAGASSSVAALAGDPLFTEIRKAVPDVRHAQIIHGALAATHPPPFNHPVSFHWVSGFRFRMTGFSGIGFSGSGFFGSGF